MPTRLRICAAVLAALSGPALALGEPDPYGLACVRWQEAAPGPILRLDGEATVRKGADKSLHRCRFRFVLVRVIFDNADGTWDPTYQSPYLGGGEARCEPAVDASACPEGLEPADHPRFVRGQLGAYRADYVIRGARIAFCLAPSPPPDGHLVPACMGFLPIEP